MVIKNCVSAVIRNALLVGFCFGFIGCSTTRPELSTFEVVLNKDVRVTLPLSLFENAMILDTFSVRFADGASLTLSGFNLRDFSYLDDIRDLPEYALGIREIDTKNMDKEQIEDLVGIQRFVRSHVGDAGEIRVIDAPKGKVYAFVGDINSIAYLTYFSSKDVLLYVDASKMKSHEFLSLIEGGI